MSVKRTYDDGCAVAHGLDLIGERWALLVARELIFGPKRFTDLRAGMPHASPNVLAQRLRELVEAGIVERRKLPPPAASRVYALTEWGRDLEPVLRDLGRWASRSPMIQDDAPMSVDALILSLRTMFSPAAAAGLAARYELRFGEDRFRATIANGELDVERGAATDPDAIVTSDSETLDSVIYGGRSLDDALASGAIRIEGDRQAVERLVGLFPLPPKVTIPADDRGETSAAAG